MVKANSIVPVLHDFGYERLTKSDVREIVGFPEDKNGRTIYPDQVWANGEGDTIEVNHDGKWLWASASGDEEPVSGKKLGTLEKFLHKHQPESFQV